MNIFLYALLIYLLGGIVQSITPDHWRTRIFTGFTTAATALILIPSFEVLISGAPLELRFQLSFPFNEVTCRLDSLSAFFTVIIALVSLTVVIYSTGYLKPYCKQNRATGAHYFFLAILIIFMMLVVVLQQSIAFLVAWEIMSLASFFLVAFENEKKEVFHAALFYLIAMHVGMIFLIAAFLLINLNGGGFDFNSFITYFTNHPAQGSLVFILFFIGFGTKAGFIPFHVWLPKAHPAAPGHISAIMSAVMIKTGIYGILRIVSLMGIPALGLGYFVLGISLVAALIGTFYAIAQRDNKRLLAYSSIENIGIMGLGLGLGMLGLSYGNPAMVWLGFGACLVHLLNHALFKSLLFFTAGAVYLHTHERDMEKMGGLIHTMPYTAAFSLTGCAAICGLPPLNGFIGKFLLYMAMIKGIQMANPLLNAVSMFSLACLGFVGAAVILAFTRMFGTMYLGSPREKFHGEAGDVDWSMRLGMAFPAVLVVLLGLFPQWVLFLVEKPIQLFATTTEFKTILPLVLLNRISLAFFIFILVLVVIYLVRFRLLKHRHVESGPVWGCGYTAPNPRMQYTASSFSRTFLLLYKSLTGMSFKIEQPDPIFASQGKVETAFPDRVEKNIIQPITRGIQWFLKRLDWIQRGGTQQYILYSLLFLAAAILWALWR